MFAVDKRITGFSQFITVIAQEQVAEIQLQCHLVLECSNRSKVKTAPTLFCRRFWKNDSNKGKGQNENKDIKLAYNTDKNQEHESLFQRLQTHIEHSTNYIPTQLETFVDDRSQVSQLQTVIKQKMKLLEATEKRLSKLEQLFKALLTIPPSSFEAERTFSAAGLFDTKLLSQLSDKSVSALSFLRSHYMKNN